MSTKKKFKFEVETKRIIKILASEIYDSSLALLRENVQNAYDAILMEKERSGLDFNNFFIKISLNGNILEIEDNGIGMSDKILENNFWKAGASGKKNDLAQRAGVIGTFGIGAMANFGVCSKLEVHTKKVSDEKSIHSWALDNDLIIGKACISYQESDVIQSHGTKIIAHLEPENSIEEYQITDYLKQYIEILPIEIYINNKPFPRFTNGFNSIVTGDEKISLLFNNNYIKNGFKFDVNLFTLNKNEIGLEITSIVYNGTPICGFIYLAQNQSAIMGYRNGFGLANIPISSHFNFGGIANLSILTPTAGREALTRDSIHLSQQLLNVVIDCIVPNLTEKEIFNKNKAIIDYINTNDNLDLAGNIMIKIMPNDDKIKLNQVQKFVEGKKSYFYKGQDKGVISQFSTEGNVLFILSHTSGKRKLQERYLNFAKIPEVPDVVRVLKTYNNEDLETKEFSLLFKIKTIIEEDYLLTNAKVVFSDLSHGVQYKVLKNKEEVIIHISKSSQALLHIYEVHKNNYELFSPFVKDFVRSNLYNHFNNYVPSSTKQGAETLKKILAKKRELYKYEVNDLGEMESYLSEHLSGKVSMSDIIAKAKALRNSQVQKVEWSQVGDATAELPQIENFPISDNSRVAQGQQPINSEKLYEATPPIMRINVETNKKILRVRYQTIPQLNNFKLFLGLSDRLVRMEYDFFLDPHSTKIIWGPHRVILIFTHASSELSLYYNIELTVDSSSTKMGSLSVWACLEKVYPEIRAFSVIPGPATA